LLKELGKYEISKGEFDIPEEIIEQWVITSISNTRGVLSVKVNETGFKNIILPLIQMEELKQKKPKTKQKKGVQ
jgi:ABC-type hemin transport system ATPase subunit